MAPLTPIDPKTGCPIHLALTVLGDAWTLLVVRDLMFKGRSTFKELAEGGEGIATNVLTDRLRRLESVGLVERRKDPVDGRRQRYRLTEAGLALAPMLVELVVWSADHFVTDAPSDVVRFMREDREGFLRSVREAWEASG